MKISMIQMAVLAFAFGVTAGPVLVPRCDDDVSLIAAQTIAAGGSFDGGMIMFDRGVSCTGQSEGGDSDAVFNTEEGDSLSNVITGPNQIEGVHCQGACALTNVWWPAVCENAFSAKVQAAGLPRLSRAVELLVLLIRLFSTTMEELSLSPISLLRILESFTDLAVTARRCMRGMLLWMVSLPLLERNSLVCLSPFLIESGRRLI
jgi:hypothetical protein